MASQEQRHTADPSKPIELRVSKSGFASTKAISVGDAFLRTVKEYGDHNALADKVDGEWKKLTFQDYYDLSVKAAKSFLKLGLKKYSSVMISGFNSVEWVVANFGAIFAGGLSNGVYPSNSAEVCEYIAKDSNATIAVVENDMQLQKFLKVRGNFPNLKTIIQYKGKLASSYPNVYDWEEFMKIGEGIDTQTIEDIISSQAPNECCTLIYTSGTTGEPKGIMLSHDNLMFSAKSLIDTYKGAFEFGSEMVSYLTFAHIAGQMADIYIPMYSGMCVYFAQPDALKGSLVVTLKEVQPHVFIGVPRVWEKFMAKIQQMLPPPGTGPPPSTEMMKAISQKIRDGLGFSRVKLALSCAAPLDLEVFEFFSKFGIILSDTWGMSEGTGPGSAMTNRRQGMYKLGTVGKAYIGVELKIDSPDSVTGNGEICFRGRNVMMGYINKQEMTREAIDSDGWMHSGDLGRLDEEGFLTITGRIKEVLITSGGENVAPVPIESRIKKHAPFLSNVMIIGDKRKYLTCLVTIKCDMDLNTGKPLDSVSAEALPIIAGLGSTETTVSGIIRTRDAAVYTAIQQALDKANDDAMSKPQKVQKFTVLKEDFSIPGGELGPTLKLKRFHVVNKYAKEIDLMYCD